MAKRTIKAVPWVAALLFAVLAGCGGRPEGQVREKLIAICDDDLKYIVSEIQAKDPAAVLDRPY
jgi:hypothetical protein